jgi:hypothetical protein
MSQSRSPIAAAEAQQVGHLEEIPAYGADPGFCAPQGRVALRDGLGQNEGPARTGPDLRFP